MTSSSNSDNFHTLGDDIGNALHSIVRPSYNFNCHSSEIRIFQNCGAYSVHGGPLDSVSPILVTLTSCSDSNFETLQHQLQIK